jgi:hypothetical protein
MKDFKIQLEAYTSNLIVWTILLVTIGLMVANIITIFNIYQVIDAMWAEIVQVKETNIGLYQFIEAHKDDFN